MTLYALALFIHVSAVLVVFAALSVEVLFLYRLRRASTLTEALVWIDPVPRLPLIVASSGLVIRLSGGGLPGDANVCLWLGVAQGGRRGSSFDGTARCCDWQTYARDTPSLHQRDCN